MDPKCLNACGSKWDVTRTDHGRGDRALSPPRHYSYRREGNENSTAQRSFCQLLVPTDTLPSPLYPGCSSSLYQKPSCASVLVGFSLFPWPQCAQGNSCRFLSSGDFCFLPKSLTARTVRWPSKWYSTINSTLSTGIWHPFNLYHSLLKKFAVRIRVMMALATSAKIARFRDRRQGFSKHPQYHFNLELF